MIRILTLLHSDLAIQRLSRALRMDAAEGARHDVHRLRTLDQFTKELESRLWNLIIVDPFSSSDGTRQLIEVLDGISDSTPLILYGDFWSRPASEFAYLLKVVQPANAVTFGVDDDPASLLQNVRRALVEGAPSEKFADFLEHFTGEAREILEHTLEHSVEPLTVKELAKTFYCTPRTLRRRFYKAGLQAPRTVISCCRILHAADFLQLDDRPVTEVAHVLGFGSGSNLRHYFSRHTGMTPSRIRSERGPSRLKGEVVSRLLRDVSQQA